MKLDNLEQRKNKFETPFQRLTSFLETWPTSGTIKSTKFKVMLTRNTHSIEMYRVRRKQLESTISESLVELVNVWMIFLVGPFQRVVSRR